MTVMPDESTVKRPKGAEATWPKGEPQKIRDAANSSASGKQGP